MSTRILYVCVKYFMWPNLWHISCCVSGCDTAKINVCDKIVTENKKKERIWKWRISLHKSPSKRWFRNGLHSLPKRADARGSADIIVITTLWVRHCYWRHKVGHTQNIHYQRIILQCLIDTLSWQRNLISLAGFNPQVGEDNLCDVHRQGGQGVNYLPTYLQCCNFWIVQDINTICFIWCVNKFSIRFSYRKYHVTFGTFMASPEKLKF